MSEKIDVEALSALEAKATPGPWWSSLRDDTAITSRTGDVGSTNISGRHYETDYERMEADADLIVALRNAAPALLAAYEAHDAAVSERDRLKEVAIEQTAAMMKRDCDTETLQTAAAEHDAAVRDREALEALIRETGAVMAPAIAEMLENIDTLKEKLDAAIRALPDQGAQIGKAQAEADALRDERDRLKDEITELREIHASHVDGYSASVACIKEQAAALASQAATNATLREALEPFNRDVRNGYPHNFSITVHGRNGEHVFGLLASDFDAVSAALNSTRSA